VVILRVDLKVLGEHLDALGEQRDLNFRRAGVALVLLELRDQRGFLFGADGHA
jgi:hypothetical protein